MEIGRLIITHTVSSSGTWHLDSKRDGARYHLMIGIQRAVRNDINVYCLTIGKHLWGFGVK